MDKKTVMYKTLIIIFIAHTTMVYALEQKQIFDEKIELHFDSSNEDINVFIDKRNTLYKEYRKSYRSSFGAKLRQWDKETLTSYAMSVAKSLISTITDEGNLAILKKFVNNSKNVNLIWNSGKHRKYGRGSYTSSRQEISLEILPPVEFSIVLIHELSHLYDKDLEAARNLSELESKLKIYKYKKRSLWTNGEKDSFGRYWFLTTSYLRNYKEFFPKLNSCRMARELEVNIDDDLSLSCIQITSVKMRKQYPKPHYFWSKSKWQYSLVMDYVKKWHDDKELETYIYE